MDNTTLLTIMTVASLLCAVGTVFLATIVWQMRSQNVQNADSIKGALSGGLDAVKAALERQGSQSASDIAEVKEAINTLASTAAAALTATEVMSQSVTAELKAGNASANEIKVALAENKDALTALRSQNAQNADSIKEALSGGLDAVRESIDNIHVPMPDVEPLRKTFEVGMNEITESVKTLNETVLDLKEASLDVKDGIEDMRTNNEDSHSRLTSLMNEWGTNVQNNGEDMAKAIKDFESHLKKSIGGLSKTFDESADRLAERLQGVFNTSNKEEEQLLRDVRKLVNG